MSVRIVCCIDVDTDDPIEAYKQVHHVLNPLASKGIEWETTDEWFDSEGEPIDKDTVMALRSTALEQLYPELYR